MAADSSSSAPDESLPLSDQYDQSGSELAFANINAGTIPADQFNAYLEGAIGQFLAEQSANLPSDPKAVAQLRRALLAEYQAYLKQSLPNVGAAQIADELEAQLAGAKQTDRAVTQAIEPQTVGDPVNLATGQLVFTVTDFTVPGAGIDLEFRRTYKSGVVYFGPLGASWDHTCNLWLRVNADSSVTAMTGEFRPVRYEPHQTFPYYLARGDDSVLTQHPSLSGMTFRRTSPDGRVIEFTQLGTDPTIYPATEVRDRFGNWIRFAYVMQDSQFLLDTVTVNNDSRVLSFSYDEQSLGRIARITISFQDGAGNPLIQRVWNYAYDDFGDLIAVTSPYTDEFPEGRTTQYEYSSLSSFAIRAHDLLSVTDPNGDNYLQNEYGIDPGTLAFGRVVAQRVGTGVFLFDYAQVLQDDFSTFADQDRPTTHVIVTGRNGQSVRYVLSYNGNVLLSREKILGDGALANVMWRYSYDADGRCIGTLSPQGRMTQSYYGRQLYYDQPGADESIPPQLDSSLSAAVHATFANVLVTIKRGTLFDFSSLSDDLAIFGSIFPPPLAPPGGDIVTRYTYEPHYQQRATVSDPRYTTSADPNIAGAYNVTTTTFSPPFRRLRGSPGVMPTSIQYPDCTYPAPLPNGATQLTGATLTFDAYDSNGRLLRSTEPEGNVRRNTYFPRATGHPTFEGVLASQIVGAGVLNLTTQFIVNEAGEVIATTDPRGNTTRTARDGMGLVRLVTLPVSPPMSGATIASNYDGNLKETRRVTAIIMPDGAIGPGSPEVMTTVYNTEGSPTLTAVGDSSGVALRQTQRDYDASNKLVSVTLPRGNTLCYEYDERRLLKRATHACCTSEASTISYGYDLDGLPVAVTDPRGGTTRQLRDAFGRAFAIIDAMGNLQVIDYDKLDNEVVHRWFGVDASGAYALLRRVEYLYDERNQRTRERRAFFVAPIPTAAPMTAPDVEFVAQLGAGNVQFFDTLTYRDRNLRVVRVVDAILNATTMTYDAANRCTTTTDAVGSTTTTTYDAAGNVVRVDRSYADAAGVIQAVLSSTSEFDPQNRVVLSTDGAGNRTKFARDSRGLTWTQTDPLGHQIEFAYDAFREKVRESHVLVVSGHPPTFLTTRTEYDANGNVAAITDPRGNRTTFLYDGLDRTVAVTNPDGTVRTSTYDRAGNLVERIDEDRVIVRQVFDALNRRTSMLVQAVGVSTPSAETFAAFAYDGVGGLLAHRNDFLAVERQLDSLGRCYEEQLTYSGLLAVPQQLTITRAFDPVSNLEQLGYPSGQTLSYRYDPANRLVEIQSVANATPYPGDATTGGSHSVVTKAWWGPLAVSSSLGNGLDIDSAYDTVGRRVSDRCSGGGTPLFTVQQLWNADGNRALDVEQNASGTVGTHYGYDSTNRLTDIVSLRSSNVFAPGPLAPPTTPPIRLTGQRGIDALTATYVAARRPRHAFAYDLAGNRSSETNAGTATAYVVNARNEYSNVGSTTYQHNNAGRLVGDGRYSYAYNLAGQLVEASPGVGGSPVLQVFHDALGRTIGVVEGGMTRALMLDGGSPIEFYDGGSLTAVSVWEAPDRLCFFASGGQDQYVVRDVLGSTRLTTDATGAQVDFVRYDAFGVMSFVAPTIPICYSGKYRYASLDWIDFQWRQYVPALGRFAQPDPTGFADGPNLFTFGRNNPISFHDPTGTAANSVHETPVWSDVVRAWEALPTSTAAKLVSGSLKTLSGLAAPLLAVTAKQGLLEQWLETTDVGPGNTIVGSALQLGATMASIGGIDSKSPVSIQVVKGVTTGVDLVGKVIAFTGRVTADEATRSVASLITRSAAALNTAWSAIDLYRDWRSGDLGKGIQDAVNVGTYAMSSGAFGADIAAAGTPVSGAFAVGYLGGSLAEGVAYAHSPSYKSWSDALGTGWFGDWYRRFDFSQTERLELDARRILEAQQAFSAGR